jgi:molybdopterin/thiamine biosynthesis adenylyltransferase
MGEFIIKGPAEKSRFSDAIWAKDAADIDILIGGAGGIGSWLTLFLASIGYTLHIFDFDTVEVHNLGGQFYGSNDIGISKLAALKKNILEFRNENNVNIYVEEYKEDSLVSPIMISALDNMKARRIMFDNWKAQEDRVAFLDGRMQAELGMFYCVLPGQEEMYEAELFDDSEVEELNCSYKSTTHCGAFIGSQLTSLITNLIYNIRVGIEVRSTPFKMEFELGMMNVSVPEVV